MAKGKKLTEQEIHNIMVSYFTTRNYSETSREVDIPFTTVRDTVIAHKDDEEFVKLRYEKIAEFGKIAAENAFLGATLARKRLKKALEHEAEIDDMIAEIAKTPDDEISKTDKTKLIGKLEKLKVNDLREISTAVGTFYDKAALESGKPTENINLIGAETLDKLAELAGYEHK